jgi:hypothetical protein
VKFEVTLNCRDSISVSTPAPTWELYLCCCRAAKVGLSFRVFDQAEAPKQYTLRAAVRPYYVGNEFSGGRSAMAANQVVLYFDRQEDAVQFTLAASSIIADGAALRDTALKVAKEVCKATRITTEGSVEPGAGKPKTRKH